MALPPARAFDPALRQRIVSGLVLAAAALAATIVGGWLFVALILVAVVIMAGEWSRLATEVPATAHAAGRRYRSRSGRGRAVPGARMRRGWPRPSWWPAPIALALLGSALPGWRPLRAAGGALYVGVPALALVWLRANTPGGMQHVLWLLIVIWATDICAYLVGRTVGGPEAGAADQPRQDLVRPAGRCGRGQPARRLCGAGARRRLLVRRGRRRLPGRGRPGRRSVRIGPQAAGRRQGQRAPDPRPWRAARSDRRAGVRGAGVCRPGLARAAGRGHDRDRA